MLLVILLAQQPIPHRSPLVIRKVRSQLAAAGQGANGQCRDPGSQVCIDRPASVAAYRGRQELATAFDHRMARMTRRRQAHDHEAGQRGGFKKPSGLGLDGLEHADACDHASSFRRMRASGFLVGIWWCMTCPTAINAGKA